MGKVFLRSTDEPDTGSLLQPSARFISKVALPKIEPKGSSASTTYVFSSMVSTALGYSESRADTIFGSTASGVGFSGSGVSGETDVGVQENSEMATAKERNKGVIKRAIISDF